MKAKLFSAGLIYGLCVFLCVGASVSPIGGGGGSLPDPVTIAHGGTGQATALPALQALSAKGADIASAATTDLSTATGPRLNITGTATITSFGTVAAGNIFTLEFTGASAITYNATSMITLTGANETNANGTVRIFESLGSGNWKEILNNLGGTGTPGGSDTQMQRNNAGAFGGTTGETSNGTVQTLTAPVLAGIVTSSGANILTANAMGAFSIDVTKENNTKSISADQTFTFSATPATDTWFSCIIRNTDTMNSHVATIPSSVSVAQSIGITTLIIPANSLVHLTWRYDGTSYYLYGEPPIFGVVGYGRPGAQSAANASVATYTVGAVDRSFEVSMNMNVTAATAISTSMNCTYTDESNTPRTMIFPTTSLSGSFVAGGLVTGTGAFETPVMHIRCKAATSITLFTAAGTFTGATYTVEGVIKRMQ